MDNSNQALVQLEKQLTWTRGALRNTGLAAYAGRDISEIPIADQTKLVNAMALALRQTKPRQPPPNMLPERRSAYIRRAQVSTAMRRARDLVLRDSSLSPVTIAFVKEYCPCE